MADDIALAMKSSVPTTIANCYLIHPEVVGKGAWSVVKRCSPIPPYIPNVVLHSPILKQRSDIRYVVKIIEKEYLISLTKGDVERAMAEVKREIEVLKHVPPNKHVVNFIEDFETDKHFLLVFEEVQCGDLCELILQTPNAKLDEPRAKKYAFQLVQAVLHCHTHDVIHRDIKPENLLVNQDDDLKLTDFGLAKWSRGGGTPFPNSAPVHDLVKCSVSFPGAERMIGKRIVCSDVIGTPRYGAPEMFYAKFSQTQYDGFKADTWSVGVVVYIILSGTFPFCIGGTGSTEHETFKSIVETPLAPPKGVSALAVDFVQRLLEKDPMRRMALADALDHPWLEAVATEPLRRSEAVAKVRALGNLTAETEGALRLVEDEVHQLYRAMTRLRRELLLHKLKDMDAASAHASASGKTIHGSLSTRRPETPPPGGRSRLGALSMSSVPTPAHRLLSPSRVGSSTARPPGVPRVGSPSRTNSGGGLPSESQVAASRASSATFSKVPTPAARATSPLTRSNGSTLRRGTPLRATGVNNATPITPTSAKRSVTPTGSSARGSASSTTKPQLGVVGPSSGREFAVGENVVYKNLRGVVQFNGTTTFGPGTWIGLEMLEGDEGTNDGTSFVDKKRYFTCPKGKGLFVRASQIKKLDPTQTAPVPPPTGEL